jgi:hypothetical protein
MKRYVEGLLALALIIPLLFLTSGLRLEYSSANAYGVYNGQAGSKHLFSDTAVLVSPDGSAVSSSNPLSLVQRMSGTVNVLLNATSAVAAGSTVQTTAVLKNFQAVLNGASAVSATVLAEGSIDGATFITLCTFSLTAASAVSDACDQNSLYPYIRGNLTAVSGVGDYSASLFEAE